MKKRTLVFSVFFLAASVKVFAQKNVIPVATPFLITSPDARSSGMGEIGVATPNDAYSNYWNNAKTSFAESQGAVAFNYSPYLPSITTGMNVLGLSGYKRVAYNSSIGFGVSYLTEQESVYRDMQGVQLGVKNPFDLSIGGSYSMKLNETLSVGAGLKYIHSGVQTLDAQFKDANAVSGDVGLYSEKMLQDNTTKFSWGVAISNIGNKISYGGISSFQPTNLRIGTAFNFLSGENSSITVGADANKLLVPTPPIRDSNGNVIKGMNDNRSVFKGLYSSFYDAPGGFSEELKSVGWGLGGEYAYKHELFLRLGGYYENENKGEKRYITTGLGCTLKHVIIDGSYLFPVGSLNPYKNVFHLTITFLIDQNNGL